MPEFVSLYRVETRPRGALGVFEWSLTSAYTPTNACQIAHLLDLETRGVYCVKLSTCEADEPDPTGLAARLLADNCGLADQLVP